jgi:serine/threonine protein phosphatase PrpC
VFEALEVAAFTQAAPFKAPGDNEDAIGLFPLHGGGAIVAVADGVGGQPGGASAAKRVLECVWDAAAASSADDESALRGAILDGIERGNRLLREAREGACTIVAAEIVGDRLRPYHVGDSALWVTGQRGRLKLQTVAHSPVGYAVEAGLLDANEALHHEDRHFISNAVGTEDMRIEVGSTLPLAARDTVLLASDGLFDNLEPAEIVEFIRRGPLAEAARQLATVCAARMIRPQEGQPSKPDDLAFVLMRRV